MASILLCPPLFVSDFLPFSSLSFFSRPISCRVSFLAASLLSASGSLFSCPIIFSSSAFLLFFSASRAARPGSVRQFVHISARIQDRRPCAAVQISALLVPTSCRLSGQPRRRPPPSGMFRSVDGHPVILPAVRLRLSHSVRSGLRIAAPSFRPSFSETACRVTMLRFS